jgi:hypothetical protein
LRVIPNEEGPGVRKLGQKGRPATYDWASWFANGQSFEIVKGVDYSVPTENMRVQVNKAAQRYNGRATTQIFKTDREEGLKVRFVENAPEMDVDNLYDKDLTDIGDRNPMSQPLGPPT